MTPEGSDIGFAQILVIAALAVLAAILTVAISSARLGSQQISALDARVFADATLDSGLALLRDALDDPANDAGTDGAGNRGRRGDAGGTGDRRRGRED